MRLVRTAAYLRACRQSIFRHRSIQRPWSVQVEIRDYSTEAPSRHVPASERIDTPYPARSILHSDEVDPGRNASAARQKAQLSHNETTPESRFLDQLKAGPANKIIHDGPRSGVRLGNQTYAFDGTSNTPQSILDLVSRDLYAQADHPIAIMRALIESCFPRPKYTNHVAPDPVVSTYSNFDVLGFPKDHPGRSRTDTYYIDSETVLRTHTSAHQHTAFKKIAETGIPGYTVCADVYRRDSIDRSHFPVFHQMEGAMTWANEASGIQHETRWGKQMKRRDNIKLDFDNLPKHDLVVEDQPGTYNLETNPPQLVHDRDDVELVVAHLKRSLELLVKRVFEAAQAARGGPAQEQLKVRWIEAYFPFTSPSFELEVFWNGQWLELLGCGVVKQQILNEAGLQDRLGWAWGIGIERLAMLLFNIPDIRLFWSKDPRFLDQFKAGKITRFEPYSKYPACHRDVSFWVNPSKARPSPIQSQSSTNSGIAAAAGGNAAKASPVETQPAAFHENDLMEVVRDVAGTLVEDVKLIDEFVDKKTPGRKSLCYRINYRANDRTLLNEEINRLHSRMLDRIETLPVQLR